MMKSYRTRRNVFDQEGKWLKAEEARITAVMMILRTQEFASHLQIQQENRSITGPVPVILSNDTRLLIENEPENFIADSDNSPMIIESQEAPVMADIVSVVRH